MGLLNLLAVDLLILHNAGIVPEPDGFKPLGDFFMIPQPDGLSIVPLEGQEVIAVCRDVDHIR